MNPRRRRSLLLCAGAALVAPAARAQVPGRSYRIGIAWLADAASTRSYQDAFLDGLRELGFEAGRNLVVDVRNCNGDAAKLPGYVDELIALKPDLLAGNDQVAQSIQRRTARIPIVLTISNDLMFSSQHCNFSDPELQAAAAQSYGVLREIAAGLDWDKAEAPDASLRAEMMLWSLVHGYAQLSLNGQFTSDPATGRPLLSITDVTPSFGYRGR